MTIKLFLRVAAVTTFIIGVTLILIPGVADYFLTQPINSGSIFVRFLGSALVGYSYLNWATAYYDNIDAHATIIGNLSTLMVALLLSILGVMNGSLTSAGWLIVLLHGVFAGSFGYFYFQTIPAKSKVHE